MDRDHLAKLYTTGDYADCVVVSQNHTFRAHRFVLSQYPQLTEIIDGHQRIQLSESAEVTERLLQWMYGIEWSEVDIQSTRAGVGAELMNILSLCDAADKYEIPKLGDAAYGAVGEVIGQIDTAQVGLEVLRDLTEKEKGAGALQRTIIDRILSLLPRDAPNAGAKRKRTTNVAHVVKTEEPDLTDAVTAPERPKRVKMPTSKARGSESPVAKKVRKSAPAKISGAANKLDPADMAGLTLGKSTSAKLHCVCKAPEDPYLVQCEGCEKWFHPGCIGKGKYGAGSYAHARKVARAGDEKMYREQNLRFTCTKCDAR